MSLPPVTVRVNKLCFLAFFVPHSVPHPAEKCVHCLPPKNTKRTLVHQFRPNGRKTGLGFQNWLETHAGISTFCYRTDDMALQRAEPVPVWLDRGTLKSCRHLVQQQMCRGHFKTSQTFGFHTYEGLQWKFQNLCMCSNIVTKKSIFVSFSAVQRKRICKFLQLGTFPYSSTTQ